MMRFLSFLLLFLPLLSFAQTLTNNTNVSITKTWSQEPNGWTYPMDISVPSGTIPEGGFPVAILLHGNGGNGAEMMVEFEAVLDCHVLVAPSGYMESWNICDEDSDAPDVAMVEDLVNDLQSYTNVNPNKIRILGVSNGAALASSIFIQNTNTGIDIVCGIIAQLSDVQFHAGAFHYPSAETSTSSAFCGYDTQITPITGRKYLSICNENDDIIPYDGGASVVGINFIPAEVAARLMATSQGYNGPVVVPDVPVDNSTVYEAAYLSGQVVLLKGDAGHGMNEVQKDYITSFFENCAAPIYGCTDPDASNYNPDADIDDGSCEYNTNVLTNNTVINITKTWSQEPNGWTYPIDISVPTMAAPAGGFPLCVVLHGNGGNGAGTVNAWKNQLSTHIVVGPSGYANSWNISDENSEAPDVEMVEELVLQLQNYENVNPNRIRILGTSNGAALANRVFIENNNEGVDIICAIVSHLSEAQYHNGNFYAPSGETGGSDTYDGYDVITTPITGRKYLNISNVNDGLIPYNGGPSLGVNFLDAQWASYIIAQSQGDSGTQITGEGTFLGDNVYEFAYLDNRVVHLNGEAGHTTNQLQKDYVTAFFNDEDLTNVSENISSTPIAIYPNPVENELNIETNLEDVTFELYDLLGNQVISTTNSTIDMQDLPKGCYFIMVKQGTVWCKTQKILKK